MNPYQQLLEAARRGDRDIAPITKLLGIRLVAWSEGTAKLEMEVGPQHHNPHGVVHGGILGDIADAACGCAVASRVDPSQSFTSIDLHLAFLRPVQAGSVVAEARVIKSGRRTCYVECEVVSGGKLLARATSTLLMLAREKP
jgi:uncharacterized protein (TIGR00369 family)